MNTRKIHTKIWQDDTFSSYSKNGKILFLYLLTNPKIGFTGMFECSDRVILFDTGLTKKELEDTKIELSNACSFYQGWVFVKKAESYDPIKGEKNPLLEAYQKELQSIPEAVLAFFKAPSPIIEAPSKVLNGTIDGLNGNGKVMEKGEIVTKEGDDLNEEFFQLTASEERISPLEVKKKCLDFEDYCASKGKRYKSKRATVRGWIRTDIRKGLIKRIVLPTSSPVDNSFTPVDPEIARVLIQKARNTL